MPRRRKITIMDEIPEEVPPTPQDLEVRERLIDLVKGSRFTAASMLRLMATMDDIRKSAPDYDDTVDVYGPCFVCGRSDRSF